MSPPLLPRRSHVPLMPGATSALLVEVHPTGVPGQAKILVLDVGAVPVISAREAVAILVDAAVNVALLHPPGGGHDDTHGSE